MTTQTPSTPVKVPPSAANYTAATLDPDLRSQINSVLIKEGHVSKIQESLLHSLHAHPSNWPTQIQSHALALLRSGEVSNFPALLRRVIEDVRQDTALSPGSASTSTSTNGKTGAGTGAGAGAGAGEKAGLPNGVDDTATGAVNGGGGGGAKKNDVVNGAGAPGSRPSLAVPQSVVDDALRVTRDCLEAVCDMDESGAA